MLDLPTNDATAPVTETGWHIVWTHLSDRPMVLWAMAGQREWRWGATKIQAVKWAGPVRGGDSYQ